MLVAEFCRRVGINLAGLDVIFAIDESSPSLWCWRSIISSDGWVWAARRIYRILKNAIKRWLRPLVLSGNRFSKEFH